MVINPRGPEPPYRQLAALLRAEIERGDYPADEPLPSEHDLMERYEVARGTARRAIDVLREEGLVYTVPRRGTYIVSRKPGAES